MNINWYLLEWLMGAGNFCSLLKSNNFFKTHFSSYKKLKKQLKYHDTENWYLRPFISNCKLLKGANK